MDELEHPRESFNIDFHDESQPQPSQLDQILKWVLFYDTQSQKRNQELTNGPLAFA